MRIRRTARSAPDAGCHRGRCGHSGGAGELGRIRLARPDGSDARLEDLASGTAIAHAARTVLEQGTAPGLERLIGDGPVTARAIADAATAGDPHATDILAQAAHTLGRELANLVRLTEPELIAVGGGVSQAGALFWDPLRAAMADSLRLDLIEAPRITPAVLPDDAGLYGAALELLREPRP